MIQSSHQFGLATSSLNLSESSSVGWAVVLGFAALILGSFALTTRALTPHPPNWTQTNLTTRWQTKPAGLIGRCMQGVRTPPRTLRRLCHKNVAGGYAPRPRSAGVLGREAPAGSGGASPSGISGGAPTERPPAPSGYAIVYL